MVQVGTALHQQGTGIFDRLLSELSGVMQTKGYSSLDEFRGQLRTIE
jgi:dihydroorotate dehydrogenase (fumarate)